MKPNRDNPVNFGKEKLLLGLEKLQEGTFNRTVRERNSAQWAAWQELRLLVKQHTQPTETHKGENLRNKYPLTLPILHSAANGSYGQLKAHRKPAWRLPFEAAHKVSFPRQKNGVTESELKIWSTLTYGDGLRDQGSSFDLRSCIRCIRSLSPNHGGRLL